MILARRVLQLPPIRDAEPRGTASTLLVSACIGAPCTPLVFACIECLVIIGASCRHRGDRTGAIVEDISSAPLPSPRGEVRKDERQPEGNGQDAKMWEVEADGLVPAELDDDE